MTDLIARLFPNNPEWTHFWTTLEFGREGKAQWVAAFVAVLLIAVWIYRRDSRQLGTFWRVWLVSLRVAALLVLLVVTLLPQQRNPHTVTQPSRVVFVVDTSMSMNIQDKPAAKSPADLQSAVPTRAATVQALMEKSPLLDTLRKTHQISVYTFDSRLNGPHTLSKLGTEPEPSSTATGPGPAGAAGPDATSTAAGTEPSAAPAKLVWSDLLKPTGLETRLGESVLEAIRKENGETLAGLVLITDGGSNAGIHPTTAADAAVAGRLRLIPVGVGSTRQPVNLQLAEIQAPTHVHVGDGFSLTAFLTGQGLAGQVMQVELLSKPEQDEGEPAVLETREVTLLEDGVPVSVSFDYTPSDAGRREFRIRAKPKREVQELIAEDNQDRVTVEMIDRKTRVLLLAGGPMRDYQFVRNLLHRDRSIELDVLLQTGTVGISQESDHLLTAFPDTREDLFNYDVIIAFDPDWRALSGTDGANFQLLSEWVYAHAGGLILVAGEVHTSQLASASDATKEEFARLLELYPVILDSHGADIEEDYQQPWPIEFTPEGMQAGFLQLTDNASSSASAWKEFAGIFRCFPTEGPKAGATVYATFPDPRLVTEPPILLAAQYFGAGRVMYVGSAEMWRLRALDEDYYDRLWIKAMREVGQGRLLRGTNRGILLLEKKHYPLGATVQVRARVLDPQFKDLEAERVPLEVYDPKGTPLIPPIELLADKHRKGHFTGTFVAGLPGTYTLELPIPDSTDQVKDAITVKLPNLEYDHPEQNEQLLRAMAREDQTGGKYLTLDEAAAALPGLLPDRTTEKVQYDFPRTLWDQQWVMFLLVGLLSAEWLTRKLLKLA